MVAHTRVKTPTAAAEYLIATLSDAAAALDTLVASLTANLTECIHREEARLQQIATRLPSLLALVHTRQLHRIEQIESRLKVAGAHSLVKQQHRLQLIEKIIEGASPAHILQRGYSITRCDGHVVRNAASLPEGTVLTTEFADGQVNSLVFRV